MAQNLLVGKFYHITDHTQWYTDRTNENNLVGNYEGMAEILESTARKHLVDLDDVLIHRDSADHIRTVFQDHFHKLYDLWKQGGVNILYCDLDVVFLNQARVFGEFDQFSMFNFGDPPSTRDDHYGLEFPYYFNCGVRYYPATMDDAVWQHGFQLLENWNPDRWDCEQIIYNAMLWTQPVSIIDIYRPRLNWQMLHPSPLSQFNTGFNGGVRISDASIVHVHGSRGSGDRLSIMSNLAVGDYGEETVLL